MQDFKPAHKATRPVGLHQLRIRLPCLVQLLLVLHKLFEALQPRVPALATECVLAAAFSLILALLVPLSAALTLHPNSKIRLFYLSFSNAAAATLVMGMRLEHALYEAFPVVYYRGYRFSSIRVARSAHLQA
jgi:hypothetical protein